MGRLAHAARELLLEQPRALLDDLDVLEENWGARRIALSAAEQAAIAEQG